MFWTSEIPYFPKHELQCKGSGVVRLDIRFASQLPTLREKWGAPLTPTSICRSPEHNRMVGGHENSLHLTKNPKWPAFGTMAADIAWRDWSAERKLEFARLAFAMGWSVGLHNSFCHIDRRADLALPELPQVVFLYGSWDGTFDKDSVQGAGYPR